MNTAEIIEVTDMDYRPSREDILAYPGRTFSEDIAEYILKYQDNDDLQDALKSAWEWDRDLVQFQFCNKPTPWDLVVTKGDCMKELIYKLGKIVYANFLASTEAK